MPKVKANAKQSKKQDAKQAPKVSQTAIAAVTACFKQDAAVQVAQVEQGQKWLNAGQVLAREYKDKDTAREVLKEIFTKAGKDVTEVKWSSYISKILSLGFPKEPEVLAKAVKANKKTGDLLLAANGSLKPNKSGSEWVRVAKPSVQGGARNKKTPYQQFEFDLAKAFTNAKTSKLKVEAVANAIIAASKGVFTPSALAEAVKDAADEA